MQKRRFLLLVIIVLLLIGCRLSAPILPAATVEESATLIPGATVSPSERPPTTSPTASPTSSPTVEPTDPPTQLPPADAFDVRFHPDGALFVGDLVSFEVISPEGIDMDEMEVAVRVGDGEPLAQARFGYFGIGDRRQATLRWVWDTSGLMPGDYELAFDLLPDGETIWRQVTLLPEDQLDFPEPDAAWAVAESDCCLVYYVTGSAADRDLEMLLQMTEEEAGLVVSQLGGDFDEQVTIVFLPRVLGHGGFAGSEMYVSYLDRNYAGNASAQVIHHEFVHVLDGRKGGELRPSIFVEGLAVYLSGGHFKEEPIVARAAALLDLELYIPLEELTRDFYHAQHEISYLEGAALIHYMVQTWGWEAFETFYRDIRPIDDLGQVDVIDAALQTHFDLTFEQLETGFIEFLDSQPDDPLAADDIRLTVFYYDSVRRYQQQLDRSAYFLTAWLLGIEEMSTRGIVADYLRNPSEPYNLALETLLISADEALRGGDYSLAESLLISVNRVLEQYEKNPSQAFEADVVAADYLALVNAALAAGYEPQRVDLAGDSGRILGTRQSYVLEELLWMRNASVWQLAE